MGVVLFFSIYRKFTGGHLKARHYLDHVLTSRDFTPRIWFSDNSRWQGDPFWDGISPLVVDHDHPIHPDVLFVGGRNWRLVDDYPALDPTIPILNLVQHVRHADEDDIRFEYLGRKAIRICVSPEVETAIRAAGCVGPTVVIPNGIDLPVAEPDSAAARPVDLLVAGLKQPETAIRVGHALSAPGRAIEVLTERLPRNEFLNAVRRARVTLFLPHFEEGFYLPALEGMALGTVVVCPDCIGNRSFCLPAVNAFRPPYLIDDLIAATDAALTLGAEVMANLRRAAREMAQAHSIATERQLFHSVLDNIDVLWKES
ncbi:MAG: hypothetical protein U0031_08575 [Thermomicrobiales bacterium]